MGHCHDHSNSCCSSKKEGCCCQSGSCHDHCGSQNHSECGANDSCNHAEKLLCVADMAWMEVLKEKIKEHIKANDHKIDEIARIVAEANGKRWQQKMEHEKCCSSYKEQLHNLMCGCSCPTKPKT